nr:hypothetical protein [uncultured Prevotella sp.]
MSKIELLIQKAHGGLTDVFVTNKGAWYGKTYDMRNYISHLHLSRLFYVLNYHATGIYFSIVKPLNVGRTGDYMAAWIYIPNSITVASEDLLKLVSLVQEKIVSGVEQYDNLRPLLDSSYPDLLYIDCMPVRQTEALAYRMYGQNTDFVYLGNLLAQGLDQSYYKKYKAVFFLDIPARNEVPPSVLQQMYDLSRNGFEQPAYLFPPQTLPVAGMELFVNQVPFRDKPLKTILGSKLNILLHRTGYKDVVLAVNICKPRQSFLLQNEILWEKEINAQMFHVMFKGRLAMQYQLFVNGNLVSSDHSISIHEQEARNARVEVMKPGCANYQGYLNLTQPLTHTIVLQELPIRSASHTSKSNSSVFASKKFLLGMIVYTVIVFFAGICLGDLINKNDIQENPEMSTPIENEVYPESENNLDSETSESTELKSEGKRNTDHKASRNQQTGQPEKQKDKAKSQGKETEEPKDKAGAEAAASGKSVSQSADKHASQTNGNKDNESANVSTHSSEDSQKSNKEK